MDNDKAFSAKKKPRLKFTMYMPFSLLWRTDCSWCDRCQTHQLDAGQNRDCFLQSPQTV